MTTKKTHKRFKRFTVARRVLIALAIAFCIAPLAFAVFCILPEIDNTGDKLMLSGGVMSMLALAVFVLRTVLKSGNSKLPWTVTVFISVLLLLLISIMLKNLGAYAVWTLSGLGGEATLISDALGLVEDAYGYLIMQVIGAAAGIACELAAGYCKAMLEEIKLFFNEEEQV